jgi:hypothetical protein
MRTIDYSEYGTAPEHKTAPPFNALRTYQDIADIYNRLITEAAYCLLNSNYLRAATIYSGLQNVLYGITEGGKLIALIPETLGYTMFETNMDTIEFGYGSDYGKLIISW